jgi:hypothetical protein
MVLPSLAWASAHETERVRLGRKSSMTAPVSMESVSIICVLDITCWNDLGLLKSSDC